MNTHNLPEKVVSIVKKISSTDALRSFFEKLYAIPAVKTPDTPDTSDYGLKKSGKTYRTRVNEQCRNILAKAQAQGRESLTVEDLAVLKQYSGKGGLDDNSVYEYYTPTPIAEGVWDLMRENGFENGSVLDPCTGAGVFSATKPSGTVITGCDLDPVSSQIAQILNPKDHISNSAFEDLVLSTEDNSFDCAIGNVPFGDARGENKHKDPAYKKENLCQRYFILRALDKIRPGGLCCFICPPDIVQNKGKTWENFRLAVSDKAEFLGAHKLPTGTFSEQGTQTVTDVVVFKKHPKELLERIKDKEISPDTMREANAYWDEFITGKYWQGEGKRFIHGTYVPKDSKRFMDTDKVIADKIDNKALSRKLAVKFQSRIDWKLLDAVQGEIRTYTEGDTQFINGEQHVFKDGEWEKVVVDVQGMAIDKDLYGVDSYEALKARCEDMQSLLGLSLDNIKAIRSLNAQMLPDPVKQALDFAAKQKAECQEQVFRGSVIGSLISKMARDSEQGKDICETRDRLQHLVLAEYDKYGDPKSIKKLSLAGRTSKAFGLFVNAVKDGQFSDLLAGRMEDKSDTEYDEKNPASIVDYLASLRDGEPLDFDEIKVLYKGDTPLEKVEDLADFDSIAIDPASGMVTTLARYCTGEVYPKMDECLKAIAECDNDKMCRKFQAQIDEIQKNRTWTKGSDIHFTLRSNTWLDKGRILEFLKEQGYGEIKFGKRTPYISPYGRDEGKTAYTYEEEMNAADGVFYCIKSKDPFVRQLVKYLNGGNPTSNNRERINDLKDQIAILEDTFGSWMQQQPDMPELEERYNRLFNPYVAPLPDSADLHLENLSGEISLHGYQNEEIRRLSNLGCGICGFGTGLGKSFTALGLAAYNLKKNKFRRTCIVVPSAVLENWYNESAQMFDEEFVNKKMFFVGIEPKRSKDGTVLRKPVLDENGKQRTGKDGKGLEQVVLRSTSNKSEIFKQMWTIPQSNYSIVVMTKEKFASIPIDEHITSDYMDEMVARNLVRNKEGKKSYKEGKKQAKLQEKFSDTGRSKADELPTIEQMGFDCIITDESHFFKNSLEGGQETQGIAYASSPTTSQIARDMSIKSNYIRKKNGGTGVFGLTATPVTNSPFEIFNMLSLVSDLDEFKAQGIDTPDKFIQFFANIQHISRASATGDLKDQDAVVGFKQLDALRNTFNKYCNIKTVEDVDQEIHVPNKTDITEHIAINSVQTLEYARLRSLAKGIVHTDEGAIQELDKEQIPKTFSIIRDMDRVSTDMDMFWHTITFTLAPKYKEQAEKAAKEIEQGIRQKDLDDYMKSAKYGEKVEYNIVPKIPAPVQVLSSDTSLSVVVYDFLEKAALKAFAAAGIVDANGKPDVGHPVPPKYAKLIENVEKYFKSEPKGKQIIFTDEKSQHNKLARILERNVNGLEPGRIGIINAEEASGPELDRISKAFNSGEYLLIIANKKAEVGVNLQKGTVAIHHLTLPWTPASINQRNGRGVRQGNKVSNVDVYYYCAVNTFDEYRADTLKGKANWIQQIFSGDAIEAENADFASADEMAVMLAENPEEQRKIIADQKAKKAAAEEQRKNKLYGTFIGQYLAAKKAYDNYDAITEAKIEDYNQRIAKAKERGSEDAAERIREQLEIYKKGRENGKPAAETTVLKAKKQIANAEARGEKLPYNFAEIEGNESKCIVIPATGLVLMEGDYVQTRKDIPWFANKDTLYKVVLDGRNHIGQVGLLEFSKSYGERFRHTVDCVPLYKVTVSKDELAEKQLLNSVIRYEKIYESGISKERFFAIRKELDVNDCDWGVYEKPDGSLAVAYYTSVPNDWIPAYPEPENTQWKNAVITAIANDQSLFSPMGSCRLPVSFVEKFLGTTETEILKQARGKMRDISEQQKIKIISEAVTLEKEALYKKYDLYPENFKKDTEEYLEFLNFCFDAFWDMFKDLTLERRADEIAKEKGYVNFNGFGEDPTFYKVCETMRNEFLKEIERTKKNLGTIISPSALDLYDDTSETDSPELKKLFEDVFEKAKRSYVEKLQKQYPEMSEQEIIKMIPVKYKRGFSEQIVELYSEVPEDKRPKGANKSTYFITLWDSFVKEANSIKLPLDPLLDQDVVDKFKAIGIELSVNKSAFETSYRGHKTDYPARGFYMLYDTNGYNGILRNKKDSLKIRFDAKYTNKYPLEMDKSFWLVPVGKAKPADLWTVFA